MIFFKEDYITVNENELKQSVPEVHTAFVDGKRFYDSDISDNISRIENTILEKAFINYQKKDSVVLNGNELALPLSNKTSKNTNHRIYGFLRCQLSFSIDERYFNDTLKPLFIEISEILSYYIDVTQLEMSENFDWIKLFDEEKENETFDFLKTVCHNFTR